MTTATNVPERNVRVLQPNKATHYMVVALFFGIAVMLGLADAFFWWKWVCIVDQQNVIVETCFALAVSVAVLGFVSGILCLMTISIATSTMAVFAFAFQLVHTLATFCLGVSSVAFWIAPPNDIALKGKTIQLPVNVKIIILAFVCAMFNGLIARQLWVFRRRYLKKEQRLADLEFRQSSEDSLMTTV